MLKFIYTEEGGRDIELTYNDYPTLENMYEMFADLIAARGFDRADLAYAFEDEAFKDLSLDDLCEEWREGIPSQDILENLSPLEVVEATIDALVMSDKFYVRRLK